MERRKRVEKDDEIDKCHGRRAKKVHQKQQQQREEEKGVVGDVAAEDREVEEFFAIVRRMQTAIKYFEKAGGVSVKGHNGNYRAALEATEQVVVEASAADHVLVVEDNEVININEADEEETNGVGSSSDCCQFMHARAGHGTPAGFLPKTSVPRFIFFVVVVVFFFNLLLIFK
ncbi:hypothetical protein ACFX2H_039002 [Malus domestica]